VRSTYILAEKQVRMPSFSGTSSSTGSESQSASTPSSSSHSLVDPLNMLIERLSDKLAAGDGCITLSRGELETCVQQLQCKAVSDSELREVKCELQELKAHIRLGDYAGKVFNDLKKN